MSVDGDLWTEAVGWFGKRHGGAYVLVWEDGRRLLQVARGRELANTVKKHPLIKVCLVTLRPFRLAHVHSTPAFVGHTLTLRFRQV